MEVTTKRYESDLTKKEKRQLEWKKIKEMRWPQRIDYLWTYYKIVLLFIAIFVLIASIIWSIVKGALTDNLLVFGVVDANMLAQEEYEELQEDLLEKLSLGGRYEAIDMDTTFSTSKEDPYAPIKLNTIVAAGELDILICDEELSTSLKEQDVLQDWETVLGDDYVKYEPYMTEFGLDLSKSEKWGEDWRFKNPSYAICLYSSKNPDGVKGMVDYFYPDAE